MKIFTIGYAGRKFEEFMDALRGCDVKIIIDVRRFPTSTYPEFGGEFLEENLPKYGIKYVHIIELGGYRRGYEKYMKTPEFRDGIEKLLEIAKKNMCCIMCLERSSKYCHRRFISQHLENAGIEIIHI